MSAMVKVSVIIPVYNVAPYLGECLDSVIQQSLTDIEIICIDDCSTDDSLQLLQKYAVSDSRIRILCNDKNRDVSATRNRGIREAVGKHIFFMDSDDTFFSNNALESLYDVAITDLADVVWGRTVNWYCELGKSYYEINTLANPDKDIRRGTVAGFPVLSYNVTVWNKLLLRSFVLKYCLFFDEDLLKFEDNDFSCRICIHAKTISYIAINTYKYRQRIRGDRSKMYIKGCEDAFWKCHAAKNMVSAVYNAEIGIQKIYAENIGDILRGAYRDFIRYRKDESRIEEFMMAMRDIFLVMPEGVFKNLPMEIQLIAFPLSREKYSQAWNMLFTYKKLRVWYYIRYLPSLFQYQLERFSL